MEIHRTTGHNLLTGTAAVARLRGCSLLTVQGLGHNSGKRCLAGSPHTAENKGMGNPVLAQGILQGTDHSLLANDLGKDLGTGFSGKDKIGQLRFCLNKFKISAPGKSGT
jgi:hypothetical protein